MPSYSFTLSTTDVTNTTQPTFDGTGRQLYTVSGGDLDAVISALDSKVIEFVANSNEVNQKLRDACKALIDALNPPTAVTQFFIFPSKAEVGQSGWKTTSSGAPRVLHPSQNGANVCVSATGSGGTTYWREVCFEATGGPI